MLKVIEFLVSVLLIIVIFLRIPRESAGLSSFVTKNELLGSPNSTEQFLNILTATGIAVYFGIAIKLNLLNV